MTDLPVAVIGGGPQGLAAAAHLLERGLTPLVLERGSEPAAAVAEWGHVRLFSAWPELVDKAAVRLLEPTGWSAPESGYPTGAQWRERYLVPLGEALGGHVRYGVTVTGVSRKGRDRLVDAGREEQPFVLHVVGADGTEERVEAKAVIDASGTWRRPNPAGADGLPALGERAAHAGGTLGYAVPNRADSEAYAGRHTVVIGAGDSAFNAVNELTAIAGAHPGTRITWAIRRAVSSNTFGGGEADELPERGALGVRAKKAVQDGVVELVTGFRTERVEGSVVVAEDGRVIEADNIVVLTGYRPDLGFLSEMRLDLDPTLEAPRNIAVQIDPNFHSCGSVSATGAQDLAQPEPDLYLVGMKSYGRAPTFLAMTGYEQVRSVVAELAGDHDAAARVELELPDTGVCGGAGTFDGPDTTSGGGCCGPAAPSEELFTISRAPITLS
ncbi:thioredoxin reductase [Nocardioides luteus]|uniref:Secreted protein n=1 Tax=Nocardioides luteus TaxID=1844 RepID=A0ABQ5T0V3_9ACTN|nr:NAD(P)-binding domain-containing protein [Nocardioides luteus]MDR7311442.1 thioredoxin reductase [Nocardioides luteus]GGR55566.1 putative secreted protein [Nocardioides luteus]GLJ70092.1 putative secreted protein [Nocardioides luteus]